MFENDDKLRLEIAARILTGLIVEDQLYAMSDDFEGKREPKGMVEYAVYLTDLLIRRVNDTPGGDPDALKDA